jgi:hypothetical protein
VIQALREGGPRVRMAAAWAVAMVLGALTMTLADFAYRVLPRPQPLEELSYYPSGQNLGLVSLGHAQSAADLAWLRAVQYYGEHRVTDMRFTRMTHVFDILTSLSPGFKAPYVFGAFAMAQEGFDFHEAETLMLKGIENNPRSGVLAFELGFLYYIRPGGRDLRHAAEYFEQAARQPDAPPQSARFAAYSRQNAGDLHIAYELWLEVSRSSTNKYMRDMAEREMRKIRAALATGQTDIAVKRLTTPQVLLRR